MKLIEADKAKRVMKDYWKAQVDKALTLTFTDSNEANKRINSYLEHNHELLKAIDELPSAQPDIIRCKDCVYQTESWSGIKYCEAHGDHIGKDYDYCSNARRKENGH